MSRLESVSQIQKLSALQPGDEFEVVEALCARSLPNDRFSPGRRWRCLYKGAAVMLLVGRSGETISIPLNYAECVDVQRADLHASITTDEVQAMAPTEARTGA